MSLSRRLIISLMIICMIIVLSACKKETVSVPPGSSDELFKETKYGETRYVFQMDGDIYMIDPAYRLDYFGYDLEDGRFYELTADITYLNGGVAGYVDFPQIDKVLDCKEVSAFDLNLPSITQKRYGLTLIGDYGQGDIFLHEYFKMAVWEDGKWIWQYDKQMEKDDGTLVCYRNDANMEDIEKGIAEGVLSCREYFVMPALAN